MRLAAGLAAVLLAIPPPAQAQSAEPASVCVVGDGAWLRKVCLSHDPEFPRYGHDVLGATPEWNKLTLFHGPQARQQADGHRGASEFIAAGNVFEDIAPRIADLDSDGRPDVVVVQSSFERGARLVAFSVWPKPRLLAATPYIGQRNRWLAPAGIADFDGDGRVEIAYVDRPHLKADLVFVRLDGNLLREVARVPGITNHRIGDDFISGGVRDCGQGSEVVAASADWSRLLIVGWQAGPEVHDKGPWSRRAAIGALACR